MSDLWQKLQDLEWSMYKKSPVGVFSVDGLRGAEITGRVVNEVIPGKTCLDVGSGALPLPYYMKVANKVEFVGTDPYEGDVEKEYEFRCGTAESLLFMDEEFDGVLFATSLDHVRSPSMALDEAYRVLKVAGYLFIWITLRKNDGKYKNWRRADKPAQYDDYHMWAFTHDDLMSQSREFSLVDVITIGGRERVYTFKKVIQ